MPQLNDVQPLPYKTRRRTFLFLFTIFVSSLPFLYLYATGYRFDLDKPSNIVGTGGIYVAAERSGASIYIDNELVRETRVFRTAFYAQNLDPKTHRVHVQKEGHHTWVKELPVTSHRVTEAQAFNMPLVPSVRVLAPFITATGSAVIRTLLPYASTTNETLSTTTKATSTFSVNQEYTALITHFGSTTTVPDERSFVKKVQEELVGTTTREAFTPTTTREENGVRLSTDGDGVIYAEWRGSFEQMPYYYCAAGFPRFSTTTSEIETIATIVESLPDVPKDDESDAVFIHPVQTVTEDVVCDRKIPIWRNIESIRGYEFFPGSTDLVILETDDGIYVSEIDNRAWQNAQPLLTGSNLEVYVENGNIYVYDGALIYQIIFEV